MYIISHKHKLTSQLFCFAILNSYLSLNKEIYKLTRLPVTRCVKLSLNFELLNFPNQLY